MPAKPREFFDTNILLYCFDSDAPDKRGVSQKLLENAAASGFGAVSYQVIQEFTNVCFKSRMPLAPSRVREIVAELCGPLEVVHFTMALYDGALKIFERYRTSWYDALILSAAQEAECNVVYSEDLHHGLKVGNLQVCNPFLDK